MSTGSLETAWWEQRGGIFMPLSKGLESLEMQWVVLSSHNGNNYQTEEARFWNKVCCTIQLTLGCSHQIPSVSTAERLSAQLGPFPRAISNATATFRAQLFADMEKDLDASQMKCALCRESRFWMEIELPRSPYRGFITVRVSKISWFIALLLSFPCVFVR